MAWINMIHGPSARRAQGMIKSMSVPMKCVEFVALQGVSLLIASLIFFSKPEQAAMHASVDLHI